MRSIHMEQEVDIVQNVDYKMAIIVAELLSLLQADPRLANAGMQKVVTLIADNIK